MDDVWSRVKREIIYVMLLCKYFIYLFVFFMDCCVTCIIIHVMLYLLCKHIVYDESISYRRIINKVKYKQ